MKFSSASPSCLENMSLCKSREISGNRDTGVRNCKRRPCAMRYWKLLKQYFSLAGCCGGFSKLLRMTPCHSQSHSHLLRLLSNGSVFGPWLGQCVCIVGARADKGGSGSGLLLTTAISTGGRNNVYYLLLSYLSEPRSCSNVRWHGSSRVWRHAIMPPAVPSI